MQETSYRCLRSHSKSISDRILSLKINFERECYCANLVNCKTAIPAIFHPGNGGVSDQNHPTVARSQIERRSDSISVVLLELGISKMIPLTSALTQAAAGPTALTRKPEYRT